MGSVSAVDVEFEMGGGKFAIPMLLGFFFFVWVYGCMGFSGGGGGGEVIFYSWSSLYSLAGDGYDV
jgi:hypothetical protein